MSGFDFWAACKEAIAIDSTTEHGNIEYVEFLKKILESFDLRVRTEPVSADGYKGLNLIGEKGGGPDVILLDTHLDTVSAGDPARWTETGGDPFRATVKDGKIYGLGVADVKLDFLCKLKALEGFIGERFRNRFILLGTFGEEVGLIGARAFLDAYRGQLDFALIGEPTSLKLVNRHKGRGCYEFRVPSAGSRTFSETVSFNVRGRAAHSSTPEKGINAIEIALDFLSDLPAPPGHFQIEGGHLLNIIPESCTLTVPRTPEILSAWEEFRKCESHPPSPPPPQGGRGNAVLPEGFGVLKFWVSMREERRRLSKDTSWACVTARTSAGGPPEDTFIFMFDSRYWEESESFQAGAVDRIDAASGRVLRKDASFFETSTAWHVEGVCGALKEVGLEPEFAVKMGSTEAALFGQRCTSLVFGPGPSAGNIHSPNEYNLISELELATRAYAAILRRLVAVPTP